MNKILKTVAFAFILFFPINLKAESLSLVDCGNAEISFIQNIRYTQNEGHDNANISEFSSGEGFIERTKQSYLLYLYGLGINYCPDNKWIYSISYLMSPLDTAVGYTTPGSQNIYYKIMDFDSTILAVKRKFKLRNNLDLRLGGGIVQNVAYVDPFGHGYDMLRINYRTIILQCESNYHINKRLKIGVGLNYEFQNNINVEEYYSYFNSSFKISPLSLNLNLSLEI